MTFYGIDGEYLIGGEIALSTRAGRKIINDRRLQSSPVRLKAAERIILSNHGTAKTRSLSSVYNCVGMIFASRRTWVDPDQLKVIYKDDNYRTLDNIDEASEGDVIIYKNGDNEITHVGLVSKVQPNPEDGSRDITVMSQWGKDGEYFHRIDDVSPFLGTPAEAWTDRK